MQDYPVDCVSGMKQVFNVQKMLVDIPLDMATQTVHVNGELFYVKELLQQKLGHYFILERFFHIKDKNQGPNVSALCKDDLFTLGYDVEHSEVQVL